MKQFLLFLIFPLLTSAEEFDLPDDFKADPERPDIQHTFSAVRKFYTEKAAIQAKYRTRIAEAMKHADRAEILLLSFTTTSKVPEGEDENYFPILPYSSFSKILSRKRLDGEKIDQCRSTTVNLLQEEDADYAACHFPIHGIRLYRGEELLFQTSICWKCHNYYIEYPDDFETASWVGFVGEPLKEFLMREMPIPKTEIERFEAKYGKTENKTEQGGADQSATAPQLKSEGKDKPQPESKVRPR